MQAIGLCRFSYPAFGGFQIKHKTIDERIQFLYAEDRLEERFRLFEHVALPCMKAQTNENWEMIVVIGVSLPKHHADRLQDVVANSPQITVQIHEPRPQREIMKEILNRARKDPSEPCLQFRYDDDDAVAVDFIARLYEAVDDCAPLNARHPVVGYVDLSRFDAAPLIAFTATKETDYGTETDERIPQGCGAYRADQRADTQTGG